MTFRGTAGQGRRNAWLVVVPVAVAALVALVLSLLSTPLYRATADVVIAGADDGAERTVVTADVLIAGADDDVERAVAAELVVASGSELRAEVRAVVGDEPELSVDAADDADVLEFTATSTNADNAATAANTYADVYVGRAPGAEVVDRADAPSDPYEPDVAHNVLLAALAGLVIGVVAALVIAWRDTSIRSDRQLTRITGVANLAVIPRHPLEEVRPDDVAVLSDPNSIESEAYRTLRTVLDFVAQDRPFTVLLVTSPRPGEGKSSVAANLAAVAAQAGRRLVLVDGDLRRPQVHRLFDTGNERGLSSVLAGDASLKQSVQQIGPDRKVALLTAGPPPSDPAELLSHDRLRLALEALADAADLVVIDAPPVLPVADPMILAQVADATLLVATAGFSDRREWTEAIDRLRKVDANVIGTVLLRPDSRVHATPNYRYAPSAAPAHWWVTESSRRSDSTRVSVDSEADVASVAATVDAAIADPAIVDEVVVDEVVVDEVVVESRADQDASVTGRGRATVDEYPWGRLGDADALTWLESTGAAGDDHAGDEDRPDGQHTADDVRSGDPAPG
jgi:polysaccharide biosynthesis transport protein